MARAFCLTVGGLIASLLAAPAAWADLRVIYIDAAPDLILIENGSACDLGAVDLLIDFGASPAGLYLDTSGEGAGLSGYAPVEVVDGHNQVLGLSASTDGDTKLRVEMDFLRGNGRVTLALDLDDTNPEDTVGQTIIENSEIAGTRVTVRLGLDGPGHSGVFTTESRAVIPLQACIS